MALKIRYFGNLCRLYGLKKIEFKIDCKYISNISYCHGTSNEPLLGVTLGELLNQSVEKYGTKEAIVVCHQKIRKTFVDFQNDVNKMASGLLAVGLTKGDCIGMWGPNSYEWLLTQFASAKIGMILVNINPGYQAPELEYCLKKIGIKALVAAHRFKNQDYFEILESLIPTISNNKPGNLQSDRIPSLKHIIMIGKNCASGTFEFQDVMNAGGVNEKNLMEDISATIQFDDPVNIQFTSVNVDSGKHRAWIPHLLKSIEKRGTTGNPKGATLTHHNIVNTANLIGKRLGYDVKPTRVCLPVPLYHVFGCVGGSLSGIIHGTTQVYPSPAFSSRAAAEAVHNERCTALYGTPTMFIDILNLPNLKSYDFSSLRAGIMGGAPCPEEILKAVSEHLNMKEITVAYGATEVSGILFLSLPSDSMNTRSTTVGKIADHVEIKLVNDKEQIVPIGAEGEIWARGFVTMLGYWNDPEKTNEATTRDRWYKTGDLGVLNDKGYCKIIGRMKDMIIRGGENIFPREIEEFLHTHPSIAEVQIFGIPDKRLGETVCAWIKLKAGKKLTSEDVRVYCEGKIADFKIPKHVKFVEDFPKTVTGKIQKFKLTKLMVEDLKQDGL